MRKDAAGQLVFSPSDLMIYFDSPFASFMDRLALEHPERTLSRDEEDPHLALIAEHGQAHERRVLERLRGEGRDLVEIARDAQAAARTREALRDRREVIYQAFLQEERFAGYADFLVRDGASYRVVDTKLAKKPRPYFLLQLCAYAEMLEPLLGARPPHLEVIGGDGSRHEFLTEDYFHYYLEVKRAFLDAQDAFDPTRPPPIDPTHDHRHWSEHAAAELERADHVCRVAGITRGQMKKLAAAQITSLYALATTRLSRVEKLAQPTFDRLVAQARLQRASIGQARPSYELIDTRDEPLGLARLPPPSPLDVWFDMEGYPLADPIAGLGLEYLFGAVHVEHDELVFWDRWALDRAAERSAFEAFIDWVHARWRRDPGMHIYHYAAYEVTATRRLAQTYGTREREVDELLRGEVFVDLYQLVRQALRVGTESYSIKQIERLYRDPRAGEVATAVDSVVQFARWLELPDGPDRAAILAHIRDYNYDDCVSTKQLTDWLRVRQRERAITYRGKDARA